MRLADEVLRQVLHACRQSAPSETGGILVGSYTDTLDCAEVMAASTAPSDSQKGRTWFYRGTHGLQRWLSTLWQQKRTYYLGEWHFHPYVHASPSQTDNEQMRAIANSVWYHCPEPLLMIIGGDPSAMSTVGVYVFPRAKSSVELLEKPKDA